AAAPIPPPRPRWPPPRPQRRARPTRRNRPVPAEVLANRVHASRGSPGWQGLHRTNQDVMHDIANGVDAAGGECHGSTVSLLCFARRSETYHLAAPAGAETSL